MNKPRRKKTKVDKSFKGSVRNKTASNDGLLGSLSIRQMELDDPRIFPDWDFSFVTMDWAKNQVETVLWHEIAREACLKLLVNGHLKEVSVSKIDPTPRPIKRERFVRLLQLLQSNNSIFPSSGGQPAQIVPYSWTPGLITWRVPAPATQQPNSRLNDGAPKILKKTESVANLPEADVTPSPVPEVPKANVKEEPCAEFFARHAQAHLSVVEAHSVWHEAARSEYAKTHLNTRRKYDVRQGIPSLKIKQGDFIVNNPRTLTHDTKGLVHLLVGKFDSSDGEAFAVRIRPGVATADEFRQELQKILDTKGFAFAKPARGKDRPPFRPLKALGMYRLIKYTIPDTEFSRRTYLDVDLNGAAGITEDDYYEDKDLRSDAQSLVPLWIGEFRAYILDGAPLGTPWYSKSEKSGNDTA